ncbi:hypothetical protein [Dysgonomonas sp. 521]|uniref:hypothetical protein n=1 Tax=Dysgonomonas sp. 521 TaxID=2302932 RepID=UPI0013D403A5|nr:hypothetical protein [Dysgonomonas sp. 521]
MIKVGGDYVGADLCVCPDKRDEHIGSPLHIAKPFYNLSFFWFSYGASYTSLNLRQRGN